MKKRRGMARRLLALITGLIGLAMATPGLAQTQTPAWPDLLYGTWTGTICGEPITYIFYPGRVSITESDETPTDSDWIDVIIVRSRYMRNGVERYDQYSIGKDTSQDSMDGQPIEGVAYQSNLYISLAYDPQKQDIYGTYFAPGYVCQDIDVTKSSESYDQELNDLQDMDFYHPFDFL